MRIDILSLFPNICQAALTESIIKRAQSKEIVSIQSHDIRAWAKDKHHLTDLPPYGGGQGMVMRVEPIFDAVEELRKESPGAKVILMTPAGRTLTQNLAAEYSKQEHLIVICGHYEGVDQRVVDLLCHDEISIGDYVLTNGAIAATVFVDAIVRLIPGVLGDEGSAADDSFSKGLLEFPQYTRPVEFQGLKVPDVLLSGHHGEIAKWRAQKSLEKTRKYRPDLLQGQGEK